MLISFQFGSAKASPQMSDNELSEKKLQDPVNVNPDLFSGAVFSNMEPRTVLESSDYNPRYTPPSEGSPAGSLFKTSGTASPIPLNYAGFRHSRRASGAFRFNAQQAPTAIC